MAEHHALGFAGRARGVQNRGEVVGLHFVGGPIPDGLSIGLARLLNQLTQPANVAAADFFATRVVRKIPDARRQAGHGRQLLRLLRSGHDDQICAAVLDLIRDLRSGQRGMDRHVNRAGQVNRHVQDDPLVAIVRDLHHPIAGLHTQLHQRRCGVPRVLGNLIPTAADRLVAAAPRQRGLVAVLRHAALKHCDESIIQQVVDHEQVPSPYYVRTERTRQMWGASGRTPKIPSPESRW